MPKSRIKRALLYVLKGLRIAMMAWMVGIANSINQEGRYMDDTNYKVEVVEEQEDDEPFEEL